MRVAKLGASLSHNLEGPMPIVELVKTLEAHLRGKPKVYHSQFSGA
jgi:hypothetical protein